MAGIEFLAITMKKRCIAEFWKKKRKRYIERGEWRKAWRRRRMKNEEERERLWKMLWYFSFPRFLLVQCRVL